MLIPKASSNATIFSATGAAPAHEPGEARLTRLAAKWGQRGIPLPASGGAIYELSSLDVDRASESSGPNKTTTRENNEKKENRHA